MEENLRQRKKRSNLTHSNEHAPETTVHVQRGRNATETAQQRVSAVKPFFSWVNFVVGLALMVIVGFKHAAYMYTLHENDLWFSNIKEVEREISFRTESGLYYSYYKQMLQAPSILQGIQELMKDNKTEHLRTINVLARMNIYQEIFLGAVYRMVPALQELVEPVYFYIDMVFLLHGGLVCALYAITWMLTQSWLAGLLSALFYIFNKEDTTRVSFVIPLRESFSLPFLWIQLAFITYYFKPTISVTRQRLCVISIAISTLLFSTTWQFNQFLLLLQAMALFAGQVLELIPLNKVLSVYLAQLGALLAVSLLQFGNTMIISGMCLSFILAALIVMWMQTKLQPVGAIRQTITVIFQVIFVFTLTALLNILAKVVTQQEADEHIGKFVLTKFGILGEQSQRDFDVRLYLCNGAFTFLGADVFERMTRTLVFPIYTYVHAVAILMVVIAFFQKASGTSSRLSEPQHLLYGRADLVYHLLQALFFGALAITTLRMKYLWTPYMCILAAFGVSDQTVAQGMFSMIGVRSSWKVSVVRHFLTLVVLGSFLHLVLPKAQKDLEDLREFYDPDTVELMNWIKLKTPPEAAFAGSMQLLAGVKLCTSRPITNHPHYEDKGLRERTLELYQMYGRRPPEEVHDILVKYNASYIILEDSICKAPSRGGCRLPDLIDVSNGMLPDSGSPLQGLVQSRVPRFCDAIRYGKPAYTKLFKLALSNKTFRVYQVLVQ